MSNSQYNIHPEGKVVYWVNHSRFYNSKGKHDGLEKAKQFCLEHFYSFDSIIKFDSDTETDYYEHLLNLQEQGLIYDVNPHFTIRVMEATTNSNGHELPDVTYTCDFAYVDAATYKRHIVDVKSSEYFLTNDGGRFLLLKNIFDRVFKDRGYYIEIILRDGKHGWREWKVGDKKKSQKLIIKQREELHKLKAEKHANEIAENKKAREIARLKELRDKPKLTSAETKRLKQLEEIYKI